VIVVDGDPSMRRALRTQLQAVGFNVLVFENAERLLESELPIENACLLLDIYLMPGKNGVELCRNLAAGHQLPTVLMSVRDDPLTLRMMNEARAVARLFKPFDERTLLRVIRKALRTNSKLSR
jgi:two-component system KDP operon response regulator KdpE